jgi:hypothetical protein
MFELKESERLEYFLFGQYESLAGCSFPPSESLSFLLAVI